jgi:secreted Zn-dependent insulinase-like peptidase
MPRRIQSWTSSHFLGKALTAFLEEFQFASAAVVAEQFNQFKSMVKDIL